MNTSTTAQLGAALCSSSEVVSDTTCFVERSTVRMIMLARNDALGLKAVDELRIYTAEDFRASLQPPTGGEEPTAEMLNAHLKATGAWVEPFEAEHEGGVQISGELSQADADDINAMNRSDLRKGYAASAMAQSSETVTIDDVPSCGQENDYRRAQSSAGMADALGSLDEAKALLALAYKGGSYKSKINSALHRLTHVERLLRSPALAQPSAEITIPGSENMDERFAWLEDKAADMGYMLVPEPQHPDSPHGSATSREALINELCGDDLNGGLIRDLCFTVWNICRYPTHQDGNVDWGNDTLPTVQKAVEIARAKLSRPLAQPSWTPREEMLIWLDEQIDEAKKHQIHGFRTNNVVGERAWARHCALYEVRQKMASTLPSTDDK